VTVGASKALLRFTSTSVTATSGFQPYFSYGLVIPVLHQAAFAFSAFHSRAESLPGPPRLTKNFLEGLPYTTPTLFTSESILLMVLISLDSITSIESQFTRVRLLDERADVCMFLGYAP
jgi:hypothetical protein